MSAEKHPQKQEKTGRQRSLKERALRVGAMVSSVLALGAASAELAHAAPVSQKRTEAAAAINRLEPANLERLEELPGWGIEVFTKTSEHLRDSTIQLLAVRNDGALYHVCTVVKVSATEVDTAAHCADKKITGSAIGHVDVGSPADFVKVAETQGIRYFIVDPKVALSHDPAIPTRSEQRIGEVIGMSIPQN